MGLQTRAASHKTSGKKVGKENNLSRLKSWSKHVQQRSFKCLGGRITNDSKNSLGKMQGAPWLRGMIAVS